MQEIKEVKENQDLLPEIKEPYYYAGTRWKPHFQLSAEYLLLLLNLINIKNLS